MFWDRCKFVSLHILLSMWWDQKSVLKYICGSISVMKPTWCTFHSIFEDHRASTYFEHYLLILRIRCTNGIWYIRNCHSQLILYIHNIPNAVCVVPPEDEQVMLETYRGPVIHNTLNEKFIMLVLLYWYTTMHGQQNIKQLWQSPSF
jgi:hypothetical protein